MKSELFELSLIHYDSKDDRVPSDSKEFRDLSPNQIVPLLADSGPWPR